MKETSVYLDNYEFNCTITHYSAGYPAKTWAIPEHCYPEEAEELEFDVDSVFVYNDEGNLCEVEKESIVSEYVDRIESKILEEIREESHECDDYYDY